MLDKLNLKLIYDSSEVSIMDDLIIPLLSNSCEYYRGVGFFTSGWLKLASKGLSRLIENGGTAKLVVSPILQEDDWNALILGEEAKNNEVLKKSILLSLNEICEHLENHTLNALAWMVADNLLEFKFAVAKPSYAGGDYHDKVGLFIDLMGNEVAIHGSFNDTIKGTLNGEAFSVFKSWEPGQLQYVEKHKSRLKRLWHNDNAQFEVYPIPAAIKEEIVQFRSADRPYNVKRCHIVSASEESKIILRSYQECAIYNWLRHERKGIYEMATGTGKTFTALATAKKVESLDGRIALVILVPYIHLLEQWGKEVETFGYLPFYCSGSHSDWFHTIRSYIENFNIGSQRRLCLVAVHQTGSSNRFLTMTRKIRYPSMLIADEVHRLGAGTLKNALGDHYNFRLALSATPRRWYDEIGTSAIFDYFDDVCYQYGLAEAIENHHLTEYEYNPILVELTSVELEEYEELTDKISSLANQAEEDAKITELLKVLLLKRARLIAAASGKVPLLIEHLKCAISNAEQHNQELRHVLIYCAPGTHKEVLKKVSDLGLRCHEFVHTVSLKDRTRVLSDFSDGHIQVLIAVKCLDEGVDIPATHIAYVLASSTNPMEFIQRRGRILRKCSGKYKAVINDFIVTPTGGNIADDRHESVLRREMPRFVEFAALASNKFHARQVVREMLDRNGLLDLLDRNPWDIYREAQKEMLNDTLHEREHTQWLK